MPFVSPSPLAGEGGEIERSEIKPGEGLPSHDTEEPLSPLNALHFGHPLPQGERVSASRLEETVGRVL